MNHFIKHKAKIAISSLVLIISTITGTLNAEDPKVYTHGPLTLEEREQGELTVTACDKNAEGVIVIPPEVNGLPVTKIPEKVTSIGEDTFWGCNFLQHITIPDSVTFIDSGAFIACTSLRSISLPKNIISIKNGTFSSCTSLTNITLSRII